MELINQNEELQSAYQELEHTKNRLQKLYDNAPVGYCTLDNRGLILEGNLTFCRMVNEDRNSLPGKKLNYYLAGKTGSQLYQHLDQVRQSGEKKVCHLELKPSESGCRYVQMESVPDLGVSGEVIFRSSLSDITNWKIVEEENIRHLKPQSALNHILSLLLEDMTLEEVLNEFLRHIVSLPWLGLEPAGAAFLLDREREVLELTAHLDMPREIISACRQVKLGECFCGRTAAEGRPIYSKVPERIWQKTKNPPIAPQNLYCIPISSPNDSTIGVYILYLKERQQWDETVEETLLAAARVIAGVVEHKKTEDKLKRSYDHLDERVKERTAELEDKNIALKVLLEQREKDKKDLENRLTANIQQLIIPYLEKLKNHHLNQQQADLLTTIEKQLKDITSPLVYSLSSQHLKMTPTETRICHLITQGRNSKEIAEAMNLSPETIHKHRQNIRRKCGISHKKINLTSYLSSLTDKEG
ncbi:MAG: LuxR C-terminal-related transcriptional regulator [Desulfurivibrionaceae bacterium]